MNENSMNSSSPKTAAIDERLLKVGELAEVVGKTVRALHLYEEKGLLKPVKRSGGGYRLYSHDAVLRVQWIDRLQALGLSLGEIQTFLDEWRGAETGPDAMSRVRDIFVSKLAETRKQVSELQSLENELVSSLSYLEGCTGCAPRNTQSDCGTCDKHGHDPKQAPVLVVGITKPEQVH